MLNLNHLKLIIVAYFLLALPLSAQDIVDTNRLIDVTTLAQLNAIRYDLDGNGEPTADEAALYRTAFSISGAGNNTCTGGTCQGYELTTHLDFSGSEWAEGGSATTGWSPIGNASNPFNTTFEGNGHTISNLYINTTTLVRVGLFGTVGSDGEIRNLGLEGGSVSSTAANAQVGGLVGYNGSSTISACYATGDVTGGNSTYVGGLLGYNYGGTISACYSTGSARGGNNARVGGLVGSNYGPISACYATGDVTGGNSARAGGLVGYNNNDTISACYATGSATGGTSARVGGVGGLVGQNGGSSRISNSYFDKETSRLENGIGRGRGAPGTALAKTTSELQSPTAYGTGGSLYENWNVDIGGTSTADDPWDFVGHNRYPRLRVDFDGDGMPATVAEFGAQRFYFTKTDPGIEVFSLSVSDEAVIGTIIGYAKALSGTTTWALTDANFAIDRSTGVITVKLAGATVATKMLSIEATVGSVTTELNLNVEVTDVTAGSSSPTISSFQDAVGATLSPATAVRGATVKIIGTHFSTTEANNTITVGGIEVIPTSPTATELTFTVPGAAAIGAGQIRVTVSGAANYVESPFTITLPSPTISSFQDNAGNALSPTATAAIGDIVKIIGMNFSTTLTNNTITVGSATATLTSATADELTFTVPAGASPGSVQIRVTVSGAVNAAVLAFEVTAPPLAFAAASESYVTLVSATDIAGSGDETIPSYTLSRTTSELGSPDVVILTVNAGSGSTYSFVADYMGADPTTTTTTELSIVEDTGVISTTATAIVTDKTFYVKATRDGSSVVAKVVLTVTAPPPPLAFAEASTSDTDVGFTGVSGTEKAKYVVTKTLDEVDESGDVVLILNVSPSVTTAYAYVDEGGTSIPPPSGLASTINTNGEITTDGTLAVTSMAAVFYVQATQVANFVIAKVELTVNAPPQGDADNDRLIEIATLAQLNAMRYDLNGDGMPTTNQIDYSDGLWSFSWCE